MNEFSIKLNYWAVISKDWFLLDDQEILFGNQQSTFGANFLR